MSSRLLGVWTVLISVPIVPVVILYWFFAEQNYFSLEDTAKGIVATGPIAAYVALVWICWSIYSRLAQSSVQSSRALKQILGRWSFEAESSHGTKRTGQCLISDPRGVLKIDGSFLQEGKPVGEWSSRMALLEDSRLSVVYDLTEVRDGQQQTSLAFCVVKFDPESVSLMEGRWLAIGMADASGTIKYTKV